MDLNQGTLGGSKTLEKLFPSRTIGLIFSMFHVQLKNSLVSFVYFSCFTDSMNGSLEPKHKEPNTAVQELINHAWPTD